MKIRFSNLGTIRETELDLRPLTVIIGPNNSSKTYLAYSIYGLWRQIKQMSFDPYESLRNVRVDAPGGFIEWTTRRFKDALRTQLDQSCRQFEHGLGNFFQDSSGKLFRQTKFHVDIDDLHIPSLLQEHTRKDSVHADDKRIQVFLGTHELRELWPDIKPDGPTSARRKLPPFVIDQFLRDWIIGDIGDVIASPFILPAERNALIITYKILSNRRFKLLRDASRTRKVGPRQGDLFAEAFREQGEIRYPLPVEDFLDFLADVELPTAHTDRAGAPAFLKLAALLETHIQSGNQLQRVPTVLGGHELRVGLDDGPSIDLYNASSSIKQLSALVLYLRYKAAPGQLLIIDEPEMNLHPASQVRLLEVLAILVQLGVQVLVTTHSPYFMAHLANLAQGSDDARTQTKQAAQLYLKDKRALLSQDDIGAYEMRDHRLISLKDPDFGLRWDTLSDVFSDLQQRYFALDGLAHGKRSK